MSVKPAQIYVRVDVAGCLLFLGGGSGIRRTFVPLFGAGEGRGAYMLPGLRHPYRMRFSFGQF